MDRVVDGEQLAVDDSSASTSSCGRSAVLPMVASQTVGSASTRNSSASAARAAGGIATAAAAVRAARSGGTEQPAAAARARRASTAAAASSSSRNRDVLGHRRTVSAELVHTGSARAHPRARVHTVGGVHRLREMCTDTPGRAIRRVHSPSRGA